MGKELEKGTAVCQIVFTGSQYAIQDLKGEAFDMSEWPNTTLYAVPPSMTESQARALEDVAEAIGRKSWSATSAEHTADDIQRFIRKEAKRIREEGLCYNDT